MPEYFGSDSGGCAQSEFGGHDWDLGKDPGDDGGHDAVCTAAASTQSPEEVGVFLGRCGDEAAIGCDHLQGHYMVRRHAPQTGQRIVASASNVPSRIADTLTGTSQCAYSVLVRLFVQFLGCHARADLQGRAGVPGDSQFRVESHVFQVVRPDAQRAGTIGLAEVVMPGVVDDQSKIGIAGQVEAKLDVADAADVHAVDWRSSKRTVAACWVGGGHAGPALVDGEKGGRGVTLAAAVAG